MTMSPSFSARFFDGLSIEILEATIEILPDGLQITYQKDNLSQQIHWPRHSLQLMERLYGSKPAVIGSKTMLGARLIITQAECYHALLPLIPSRHIKLSHVHHPWRITWLLAMIVLVLLILPIWQIHTVSLWIANIIPHRWEQLFWKNTAEPQFQHYIECVDPKGQQALQKLVTKLSTAANIPYPVDVKVINDPDVINAETLPDFHLFLYSGLLHINQPDAIAAILAHEMGHAVYHHVMAKYISTMGLNAFFNGVLELSSNNVAFDFLNLKYTRDYEIQADRFAIMLLQQANINTAGFQMAIEYLKKLSGEFTGLEPYLVDHPTYQERLELMSKTQPTPTLPSPSLSPEEWKALQSICDKTQPIQYKKFRASALNF